MEIPGNNGEAPKRFPIYRVDGKNQPIGERIAQYDTTAEVLNHKTRLDWRYAVFYRRQFVPLHEFKGMVEAGEVS